MIEISNYQPTPTMALALAPFKTRDRYQQQRNATWQDYAMVRDSDAIEWTKIAFDEGWLWIDMGSEGPNHASLSDLLTAIFFVWAFSHPETPLQSYGRCLIEYPESQACAPDLVLYTGSEIPRWQTGQPRRIAAPQQRLPDLVGEIADTTLSLDLDEQKQLYARLQIPEYWVVDIKGLRLFAFGLTQTGDYEPIQRSQVLSGLPIDLVEQTLERSATATNTAAANWLMGQLRSPSP